jgi:hypothetical protein
MAAWDQDPLDTPAKQPWDDDPMDGGNAPAPVPVSFGALPSAPKKTSQALGFYQGMMKPLDNLATALDTASKALGLDVDALSHALGLPTTEQAVKAHADYVASQQAQGVEPGGVGRFAGEVAGTLPTLAVSSNPIAAGAMSGALLTDAKTPGGVLTDAAIGGVAGKVGDLAVKGISRVIAPKTGQAAKALLAEGVELTPGQIAGGAIKRAEDAATSIPLVGDMIKSAQRRSLESFNKAAVNRVLKPLGTALPDNVPLGNDAVAYAGQQLDDAYKTVLPKLTVSLDGKFQFDMNKLKTLSQNLPPESAKQVGNAIDAVLSGFSPAGKMSGEAMKAIDSELGRVTRAYKSSSVGSERLMGDALKEAQSILRDVVQRSNPAVRAELKAIDRGYANLLRIENAASKAKDGIFTPGQLQTATRVMDSSLRKRASARGGALMQDLAKTGREILPSSVPDSGTATRLLSPAGIGAGIAGYLEPSTLAAGAGVAAAYTKPGQAALRTLLTRRPAAANEIANYLTRLAPPVAIAGSALGSRASE